MINLKRSLLSILLSFSMVLTLTSYAYADDTVSENQTSVEASVSDNDSIESPEDLPVIDEPVIDEPVIDEPVIDEPVIDEPVIDEPVIDEPVIDEPVVDEPIIDDISTNDLDLIEANTGVHLDLYLNENNLLLKKGTSFTLKFLGSDFTGDYKKAKKKWTSSNTKVAKVDGSGKVSSVNAGEAVITCTFNDLIFECTVHVYDITSITFNSNKLAKENFTYVNGTTKNTDMTFDERDYSDFVLTVNQNNPEYSAYYLHLHTNNAYPIVTSSNKKVATASCVLTGSSIKLHVDALKPGTADISVSFAGKKAVLKYTVKQSIKADWYDIQFTEKTYTGSAITNKILLNDLPKGTTYKTVYSNNKETGTATVTLVGTGNFAGEVALNYQILPIDITDAKFTSTKSRIFSGEPRAASVSVTKKNKLKEGRDYVVKYKAEKSNKWTSDVPVNAGVYSVRAEGIGNYSGVVSTSGEYTISKVNVEKLKLNCSSTVKYSKGAPVYPKISLVCESTTISQKTGNTENYKISYSYLQKDGSYSPVDAPTIAGTYMVTVVTYKPNIEPYIDKNGKTVNSVSKKFTVK